MGELIFVGGTVSCGKTAELVISAWQLRQTMGEDKIKILKPVFDTRFPGNSVCSASGMQVAATDMISETDDLRTLDYTGIKYILVDEIQFYSPAQIEQLREISLDKDINITCFGLFKDFKCVMFETSQRLLELCDDIRVLKAYCAACPKIREGQPVAKSTCHLRITATGGAEKSITPADSGICIGGIETFLPVCHTCYKTFLGEELYSKLIKGVKRPDRED